MYVKMMKINIHFGMIADIVNKAVVNDFFIRSKAIKHEHDIPFSFYGCAYDIISFSRPCFNSACSSHGIIGFEYRTPCQGIFFGDLIDGWQQASFFQVPVFNRFMYPRNNLSHSIQMTLLVPTWSKKGYLRCHRGQKP